MTLTVDSCCFINNKASGIALIESYYPNGFTSTNNYVDPVDPNLRCEWAFIRTSFDFEVSPECSPRFERDDFCPLLVEDSPTPAPQTDAPTVSYQICYIGMTLSDGDRDARMNTTEYVTFVNRQSGQGFYGSDYDTLPSIVTDAFESHIISAADNVVNVEGSKPGETPSDSQRPQLNAFCEDSQQAIRLALLPPTASPTASSAPSMMPSNGITLSNDTTSEPSTISSVPTRTPTMVPAVQPQEISASPYLTTTTAATVGAFLLATLWMV
jgi:hypothetical protein